MVPELVDVVVDVLDVCAIWLRARWSQEAFVIDRVDGALVTVTDQVAVLSV